MTPVDLPPPPAAAVWTQDKAWRPSGEAIFHEIAARRLRQQGYLWGGAGPLAYEKGHYRARPVRGVPAAYRIQGTDHPDWVLRELGGRQIGLAGTIRQLRRSPYFRAATNYSAWENGHLTSVIEVEERFPHFLSGGLFLDPIDGTGLSVGYAHTALLDKGYTGSIALTGTRRTLRGQVSLFDPWFLPDGTGLGIVVYHLSDQSAGKTIWPDGAQGSRYGMQLSATRPLAGLYGNWNGSASLGVDRFVYTDRQDQLLPSLSTNGTGIDHVLTAQASVSYEGRSRSMDPGDAWSGFALISPSLGDRHFVLGEAELNRYGDWGAFVWRTSVRAGAQIGTANRSFVAQNNRRIRGWPENGLLRGTGFQLMRAELGLRPIWLPFQPYTGRFEPFVFLDGAMFGLVPVQGAGLGAWWEGWGFRGYLEYGLRSAFPLQGALHTGLSSSF